MSPAHVHQPAKPPRARVEICVGDAQGGIDAVAAGADRLEVCADLSVGGLTPPLETVRLLVEETVVPLHVMVRPRAGDFVYSRAELAVMLADIRKLRSVARPVSIVTGALRPEGDVDASATHELVAAAGPLPVVFHRAIDETADPEQALHTLASCGVAGVLTSGAGRTALHGATRLRTWRRAWAGTLAFTAAGSIRPHNVREVVRTSGVSEVHLRATAVGAPGDAPANPSVVREVVQALSA